MVKQISQMLEAQSLEWLLNSASDAMIITDTLGRIILANPPASHLFAYAENELVGKYIEALLPERFRHGHQELRNGFFGQPHARVMGTGMELFGCRADGTEFPVEVSLSPLKTEQGVQLVMATIHDISQRKKADAAVQESEARMRAIFDTAVDAIVTIDEHGIVERFNPAAERLFGYSEAEIAGRNISELMPSPYREMHDAYLSRYLETGEQKIIGKGREVVGLRRDGSVFPMDLAVAEMRIGKRRMFTGMVRDITARKEAEERHERLLQEIKSANEELTSFAYVVSHDLKAPLRAIGSLADWLSTDYKDKFDEEGREHMRLLINRVHRMGALIDGILQYSRVGRVKEAMVPLNTSELVREVIDLLAPPPHIAVSIDAALPAITAEPTRIRQLFQNLISNAIKYMDKTEGEISVGCSQIAGEQVFHVKDNGPGIEQRHFEKVFQLFQTLAPRDKIESTGVGLALVKKIVEMYNGRVWVESAMGKGTTFFFTLPKAANAVANGKEKK